MNIELTDIEVRVLRRGLKRLTYEVKSNIRRNERAGWQPEPGKLDVAREMLGTIDSLLDRLPFPDYPDDIEPPKEAEQ
jgi:hypothetical protein